jgi:hypothetical protein
MQKSDWLLVLWLAMCSYIKHKYRSQPVNSGQFGDAATVTGMVVWLLCLPVEWEKIEMEWGKLLENAFSLILSIVIACWQPLFTQQMSHISDYAKKLLNLLEGMIEILPQYRTRILKNTRLKMFPKSEVNSFQFLDVFYYALSFCYSKCHVTSNKAPPS